MSQDSKTSINKQLDYRLIIHTLTCSKSHFHHVSNSEYSFTWKHSDAYSTSTKQHTFNHKTHTINFNKSKLKLRFHKYQNDDAPKQCTTTKLILFEKNNDKMIHLDEITLSSNYFVTNKRQATNITFNKIINNDLRIELKLKVTLIAKTSYDHCINKTFLSNVFCTYHIVKPHRMGSYGGNCSDSHSQKAKNEEDALSKWMSNMSKFEDSSNGGYQSSVCSDINSKRRRSGLCANSVKTFYKKSKEIEEKTKSEKNLFDEQIKNDYNEMGNHLLCNIEENKHLKAQIDVLQNLLFEKNAEIEALKQMNEENVGKMKKMEIENAEYRSFAMKYKSEYNENKILIQSMKYQVMSVLIQYSISANGHHNQLQCRWAKYNELVSVMRSKKRDKLKQCIARLVVDNNDLEEDIMRICDSWRSTSYLMEMGTKRKKQKMEKFKNLYHQQLEENERLRQQLIKCGIIQKEQSYEDDEQDLIDDDDEMNAFWNDEQSEDEKTESDCPYL